MEDPYLLLETRPDLTPEQNRKRLRDWCNMAYEEGRCWLKGSEEAAEQQKYISYLLGKQWPRSRPRYKAAPVNNRLLRGMEKATAVLTDLRPTYEVTSDNRLYDEQAKILTKTTKSWWTSQDCDLELAMAVMHGHLSTGYLRIVWNKRLMNGAGDFELIPMGIHDVMPIGVDRKLQGWEGVIQESILPLVKIRREYPVRSREVKPSAEHSRYVKPVAGGGRPGKIHAQLWESLSPQMKVALGHRPQYGTSVVPHTHYREFWFRDPQVNMFDRTLTVGDPKTNYAYDVKPGDPLYPRGRLIITAGEDFQILHDGPNPFWHGQWPFVVLRLKPWPFSFHGLSELRAKLPLQDIVNQVLAGILDMVKKAVNPPLIYPENAFSPRVQRDLDPSMPNAKIGYSSNAMAPPQYARIDQLPSFVFQTMFYGQNEMDDDSGLLDVTTLARKKVTPAGDTLQELKESQQTIMRLRGRHIEVALRQIGTQMGSNFCQYYTAKRRMFMFGPDGLTFEDIFDWKPGSIVPAGIEPEEFLKMFTFKVAPGSLLNAGKPQQAMLYMALRRQGDMDRKTLYEGLDMGGIIDKVEAQLKQEQDELVAKMLAGQAATGGSPQGTARAAGGMGSRNVKEMFG